MSWEIPEEPEKVEINKNADIGNYRVLLGTRFCPWRRRGEKVKEDVLAAVESTLKVERTGNRRRKTNVLRNTFGGLAPNTIENKKGSKTLPLNIHTATKVLDEDTTKTATTKGKYTGKYREEQSDQTQLNKKLYPPHPNSPANVDNHALNNIVCDPAKNSGIVPVSFNTEIQNESSRGSARLALEWKNMNVDIFLPKDGECKKGNEHENESEGLCLNKGNSSDKSSKYRKDQRRNTLKPKARIFSFPRYGANNRSVPGVAFNLEYLSSIKRGFGKHRERHSNNSVQTFTTAKEMYTSSSASSSETSGATSSGDGTNAEYSESDSVISDSEDSYWDVVTSEDASLGTDEFKQKPDNSELFDKKSRKEYIKDSQVTAEHKDSQSVSDLDTDVAEIKSRQNKGGGLAGADTIQTGEGVGGFVTEFKKNEDPRVGNSSLLHTSNIEERNVASNRDSQGVHGEQACEAGNKDSDDRKLDQNKGSADKNQNRLFSAILKKVLEKNRKKKVDERKRVADPKVAQNTPFGTDMEFRGDVIWLSSRAATRLIRIDKGIFERGIVPTNWNGSRGGLGAYRWTESWIALTQRGIFVFTDIIGIPDLQILFPPASKLSPKLMGHSNSDGIIGISFGYKPATKFKQNTGKTWDGPVGMFYRHTDECEKEESKPQIEASRYYMLLIKFPNLKASKVWCGELEKWINACLREYRESVIGKTTHVEFSPPSKLNVGVPLLGVNISVSTLRGALRGRGKVMLEIQEEYDNNPKQNSCKNSANNTGSSQSTKRFIDDKRTGVFLRRFVSVWDIRDLVLETLVNIPRYSDTVKMWIDRHKRGLVSIEMGWRCKDRLKIISKESSAFNSYLSQSQNELLMGPNELVDTVGLKNSGAALELHLLDNHNTVGELKIKQMVSTFEVCGYALVSLKSAKKKSHTMHNGIKSNKRDFTFKRCLVSVYQDAIVFIKTNQKISTIFADKYYRKVDEAGERDPLDTFKDDQSGIEYGEYSCKLCLFPCNKHEKLKFKDENSLGKLVFLGDSIVQTKYISRIFIPPDNIVEEVYGKKREFYLKREFIKLEHNNQFSFMMKYYSGKRRDEELEGWLAIELKAGLMSDCNADGAILYMCFGSKTIRNHWYGHLSLLTQYNNMKYGPPSLNPTLISTPRDYYSPTLSQVMKNTPLEYEKLWENLVIYNTEDSKNTVHTGIVYSGYLYKKTNKNALFQRVFCILTSGWLLEFEVPNFSDRDSMASMINAAKKSIISKDKAKQSKTDYKKEIDHIVDKVKTNLVKLQEAQDAQDAQDKHRSQQKNKKKSTAVPEHGDSSEVPNIHHRSTQNELRQNEGVSFQETESGIIEEPNYLGGDVKIAHFLFKHSRSIDLKDVYVFSNPPNCFTRRELSDAPFLSYYSAVNAQNGLLFGASDLFTRMPNLDTNSAGSVLMQNGGQGAYETSTQPLSSPEYEIGAARNPSTIQNNFEQAEIAHGLSSSGKFLKLDPVNHTFALWKPFKRKMDMNLGTSSRKKVSHLLRSRIFVPNAKKSHTSPLPERCTNESDVQNLGSRSPISVIMPLKTMCTINSILGIRTCDESSGSTAKQAPADAAHTGLSYNGYKPELGVAATPLSNRPSYLTLSNFEIQIRFPVSATILRPNTIHGRSFTPKTLNHTKPSPTDNNYGLYEPDHECALLNKNKGFTAYTAREFLSALMVSTPFEVAKPFLVKYRLAPATATSWVDMAFRYLDFSDLKQIHASVVDRGSTEGFASLKATSSALDTSINPRNMRVSSQFGEITQVFNDRNNDDGNVFYTDYGTHGVDLDSSIATQRSGGCSTSERYSNRYSQGVQADGDPVIQLMHRNPFDFVLENFGEKLVMQNTSSFVDKAPEQSGLELSTINRRFSENIHSSRRDPSRKIFEPNYHTTSASLKHNKKDEKLGATSKFCLDSNISNNGTSSTTGKVPVQHASFVNPSKIGIQTTPGASTCCSHDHSSAQTLPFEPTNIPLMCLNPLNTDGKISAIMKRNSPADESSLFLGFYIAESKLEMESWINYLNSHIAGINML